MPKPELPPSPWKWEKAPSACSNLWQLFDAKGNEILLVEDVTKPVRSLIAAAPKLLQALEEAQKLGSFPITVSGKINTAIKLVEGE